MIFLSGPDLDFCEAAPCWQTEDSKANAKFSDYEILRLFLNTWVSVAHVSSFPLGGYLERLVFQLPLVGSCTIQSSRQWIPAGYLLTLCSNSNEETNVKGKFFSWHFLIPSSKNNFCLSNPEKAALKVKNPYMCAIPMRTCCTTEHYTIKRTFCFLNTTKTQPFSRAFLPAQEQGK